VSEETAPVVSPCIRRCTLDEADVCIGCGRSLQEILDWTAMDATLRQQARERAAARRAEILRRQRW
jgi:predicted Fe-S protein YdhL (DUF1289 family)